MHRLCSEFPHRLEPSLAGYRRFWLGLFFLVGCFFYKENKARLEQEAADRAKELADLEMRVTACWLKGRLLAGLGREDEAKEVLSDAQAQARFIGDDVLAQEVGRDLEAMD